MSTKIDIIDFLKLFMSMANTFRHYTIFIFERTFVPSHAQTPGDTYMWMFCPNSHKHFPDAVYLCAAVLDVGAVRGLRVLRESKVVLFSLIGIPLQIPL